MATERRKARFFKSAIANLEMKPSVEECHFLSAWPVKKSRGRLTGPCEFRRLQGIQI